MEALRQLADRLGVTVEEAAEAAFKRGMDEMFRLPQTDGQVLPFRGPEEAPAR
jgi:hypothetical protein